MSRGIFVSAVPVVSVIPSLTRDPGSCGSRHREHSETERGDLLRSCHQRLPRIFSKSSQWLIFFSRHHEKWMKWTTKWSWRLPRHFVPLGDWPLSLSSWTRFRISSFPTGFLAYRNDTKHSLQKEISLKKSSIGGISRFSSLVSRQYRESNQ